MIRPPHIENPPRLTPTLPHVAAVCLDALLTVAQIAVFFGFLWFAWFVVWVFG